MKIKERIEQVKKMAKNDHDAITMILSACTDLASEDGAMLSLKAFGNAADHILAYFGKSHNQTLNRPPAIDVMNDEKLVTKLPLVFRTIRGEKVNSKNLDELAQIVRRT